MFITMDTNQRLSTIVFGDIKGYTALMQEDEGNAMQLLKIFKEGLEKIVPWNCSPIFAKWNCPFDLASTWGR